MPGEAGRGPFCPSETRLAAYADGQLSGETRATIEGHLAGCVDCLDAVAFLVRTEHLAPAPEVPAHLIAAVQDSRKESSSGWGRVQGWLAAAAGLILVVISVRFGVLERQRPPTDDTTGVEAVDQEPADRTVRNNVLEQPGPTVVHPADGQTVRRSALTLAWESVDDTIEYSVMVMNGAGDPVWQDRTGAQTTTIPPSVALAPGERYYVRVTAHLRSGLDVLSPAVAFGVTAE